MCSAGKLVMFAVLLALVTVVSGECEEKCHCSKYKVFCSVARLGALPTRIPNTTELVKIELDNIPEISNSTGLEHITHLQLVKVDLQYIVPGAFENMSRLEHLSITHNNILFLEADSFKYLDRLYFLNLSNNEVEFFSQGTFSGLLNIRILDLSYNKIKTQDQDAFESMKFNVMNAAEYENLFRYSPIELPSFEFLSVLSYVRFTAFTPKFLPAFWGHIPSHISLGLIISEDGNFEYVNKNQNPVMSELSYLEMSHRHLTNLKDINIQNFTKLAYLDLSNSRVSQINSDDFEGLVSLKALKMRNNYIFHLNNATFYGLQSLEFLDISGCDVRIIESRAFEGLSKLRTLDLSWNKFHTLNNYTFSTLGMLKEIIMEGNIITHIDSGSFSDLTNLKRLFNRPRGFYYESDKPGIQHLKSINAVNETAFVQLQRLDYLHLFLHTTIPKEIQVLNALHLYIHAGYDDPQKELGRVLESVRYLRSLSASLLQVKSAQFLATFYEFHVSQLVISFADLTFFNSKDLCCLPKLKSLTIYGILNSTIEEGAFRALKELKELRLYYKFNFTISHGLFLGLNNLKLLSINCQNRAEYSVIKSEKIQEDIEYLHRGVFQGMDNLTKLALSENYFKGLKPGVFHGLSNIEEIDLARNEIKKIEAGVFGAICKDEFEMSCKNVTLPEYCNNTNALKTLKYLFLRNNKISHIHRHAFVSCTNLQRLDLSYNGFLTLNKPFLYTPGLRRFDMSECSITNIPNETFACTPLLSEIDFRYNNMSKLTVRPLVPLKHLQNIYLARNNLSCDCELYETWLWMRQHRANYDLLCQPRKGRIRHYSPKDMEAELSNMTCNGTMTNISVPRKESTETYDFAFFKQYIEPIVLIIILTFGLVSNGFLLFIAFRHSDMRTKQNACIIHLSTVELLSLILNLPLSYWDVVNIRWEFDDTLCKIFIFSKDVGVAVTAFSTVALSVERFLVSRTFANLRKMCKSETQPIIWLLLMTWISATVCSLPAYLSAGVFEGRCLYCPPGNQSYIRNVWTFQLVMYCLLSAFAITFLNVKTSIFLRASIRKIPGEIKDSSIVKNRTKNANVALILVLVIVIGYLPNYILRFLVAWSLVDMEDLFLPSFFTFCLFFSNAIFNPISIFIMSSKFKSHALKYFPFLEKFQHSRPVPVGTNKNLPRHVKPRGNIPLRDFGKQYTPGNYNRII